MSLRTRRELAAKAFAHTAAYDAAISGCLARAAEPDRRHAARASIPQYLTLPFERAMAFATARTRISRARSTRRARGAGLACADWARAGKELSFNNLVDVDAALEAVREFAAPAAVVVKHTNPCGVAVAGTLARGVQEGARGGATRVRRNRGAEPRGRRGYAKLLAETFLECVVAPKFSAGALEVLRAKKNLRVLQIALPPAGQTAATRSISSASARAS